MQTPRASSTTELRPRWQNHWGIDLLLAAFVFATALFTLANQAPDRFHIDEAHKISEAYYFHLFFQRADFQHPDWRDDFYARINPPIAKYLLGGLLSLQGETVTDGQLQQDFEQLWQNPAELRQKIPDRQLQAARRVTMGFAAACCVLLSVIGRMISGRMAGLGAAGLLLAHPLFLRFCSLALTDSLLLFFLCATVPLLIRVLHRRRVFLWNPASRPASLWKCLLWETLLPTLILLGAVGTKLNGGLAAILWIMAAGCGSWAFSAGSMTRRLLSSARLAFVPPVLALGLFVALNPALYHHPFESLIAIPRIYGDWMVKQAIEPGEAITSFSRRWSETWFHATIREEGRLHSISPAFPFCILTWLALIGAVTVLWKLIAGVRRRELDPVSLVAGLWLCIYGAGIAGWIPVNWDRYFLPLVPLQSVFAAVGACQLVQAARLTLGVLKNKPSETPHTSDELGITGAVIGMSLLVSLGLPAVVDLSLIAPASLHDSRLTPQQIRSCLQRGADRHPDDPVRLMHLAELLKMTGIPQAALPFAQRAVSRLPPGKEDHSTAAMHAAYLYKLADLEAQVGHMQVARKKLLESNQRVSAILSSLTTRDPKVELEFHQLIDRRTVLANQLVEPDGTNH